MLAVLDVGKYDRIAEAETADYLDLPSNVVMLDLKWTTTMQDIFFPLQSVGQKAFGGHGNALERFSRAGLA